MKLCAVTQSYSETGGGGRTVLTAERAWYLEQGFQHVTIVPGETDTKVTEGRATTYTVASPRVPGSPAYRLLLRSGRVAEILRDEMPDIIETHCPYNLPWVAFRHRARYGSLVTALYMTDMPQVYVERPVSRVLGRHVGRLTRRMAERYALYLYSRCDAVVATSPYMRRRLLEIGVRRPRFVPLGVDLQTFSPQRRDYELRQQLGAGDDDLLLVYAGRLDREKQPDVLLDAFARLPREFPARLVLVGEGPLRPQLEQEAAQMGRVHVMPDLADRKQLAKVLASADVYVSAMAHETFGLSVVEAQASGLPVLGVRAGAMVDRVRDATHESAWPADGFLVDAGSPQQMAQRILDTPRQVWQHLGENARERVSREYSWDRTFSELMDIYSRPALRQRVMKVDRGWLPSPRSSRWRS